MNSGKLFSHSFVLSVALLSILLTTTAASGQATSFTYQGRLTDGGTSANGNYDLQFALWDAASGGAQIGSTLTLNTVPVSNGVFTVSLDFGSSSFNGANRFLEISARPIGGGSFTVLSPRQPVTAIPYAIRSLNAAAADTATNANQLGGMSAGQFVQTNDSRLSDPRSPIAGSSNYIQTNPVSAQSANFNISGNGTVAGTLSGNVVNATAQYNMGGNRVLTVGGAGTDPQSINSNIFVGFGAGASVAPNGTTLDGDFNSFLGLSAGTATTTGSFNAFYGWLAGNLNKTGSNNSFFGAATTASNPAAFGNSYFGAATGQTSTGSFNAFFGASAGSNYGAGDANSFFGQGAGLFGSGNRNTFIGQQSGFPSSSPSGDDNTLVGAEAAANPAVPSINNSTALGAYALVTQSNSLVLGSINGINHAPADTNVGIGTTAPRSALEVKRNWDGSFGAVTVTGDRPTIRFSSNNAVSGNDQWILHLGSAAGNAPAGSLSFFFGGTAGTSFGSPVMSVTPSGTVQVHNLASGGGSTQLCRNAANEITNCSSSLRYKTNIAAFHGGLDIINRLRPISFKWKQDGTSDIGFGAEEVEQVAPLFTFRNDRGEIEGVRYDRLSVLFVNAFKEQQAQIEEQREEISRRRQESVRQQRLIEQQQMEVVRQARELSALKSLVCRSHRQAAVCK